MSPRGAARGDVAQAIRDRIPDRVRAAWAAVVDDESPEGEERAQFIMRRADRVARDAATAQGYRLVTYEVLGDYVRVFDYSTETSLWLGTYAEFVDDDTPWWGDDWWDVEALEDIAFHWLCSGEDGAA